MTRHSSGKFDIRFLARAVALAGTALAVSVCGEQGGFGPTGSGADTEKPVVRVDLGPTDTLVEIADSLKFTVIVTENVRLASVHVDIAGLAGFVLAGVWDTTITSGTLTVFTKTYAAALPSNAAGQRIAITASAKDASNNEGVGGDTVRVNDGVGPVVTMITPAAGVYVGAGDTIRVLAKAVDPSGIRTLGARLYVRDTVLQTIVVLAQDSLRYTSRSTLRQDSFKVVVPASLSPGAYLLHAFAVDSSPAANDSQSVEVAINVRDIQKPGGTFNGPALDSQVVVGDTLPISFRATDNVGVTSVRFRGYRLRRDPLLGPPDTILCFDALTAQFPLLPADTNPIVRRLVPIVANETPDSVLIEARVTDVGGNVTTVTRRIQVIAGARAVTIQGPPLDTALSAGDSVLVQFRVQDRRGITAVTVEGVALRGDSQLGTNEFVPRFLSRTVSLNAVRDTTLRRYLQADSSDLRAEPVFLRVSFSGAARDTTSALRRIQLVTGASVRLISPASGLTHPVGAALPITITGFDPDSVAKLGYVSSGAIASSDSSVFTSPLSTAQSAALTMAVPNTAPLQSPDTIRPFVVDRLGNRAWGASAIVTFADSSSPTVTFASPTADTGVVAGDSVLVRVRLQDNRRGVAVSIDGGRFFSTVGVQGLNSTDTTVGRYLLFDGNLADAPDTASIIARVTDGAGLQSADTLRIQVTSGPYVRITDPANGSQVRLGQAGASILPVVSAFSPDTITYLGFEATGRVTKRDSMATTRPLTSTTLAQQLTLAVPDTTRLGTVTLTPFVWTRSSVVPLNGAPISVELVDGSLPVVRILTPARAGTDRIPAGDSLFVRVAVSDDRELAALSLEGFAHRPDVWPDSLGQVNAIQRFAKKTVEFTQLVRDTVVRYLNAVPTDSTAENVYVIATAEDRAGNQSVDTVKVVVTPGATVRITSPTSPAVHPIGTALNVTITAFDSDSVTRIGVLAAGVVSGGDSISYTSPLATTQTTTRTLAIPATATPGTVTVTPFAVDRLGKRNIGAPLVVTLADTEKPAVSIDTPAVAAMPLSMSDSVYVSVTVTDNIGVDSVVLTGVARRGSVLLGTDTSVTRYRSKTARLTGAPDSAVVKRYLLPVATDSTSELVYIIATAFDSSGNSQVDTASVRIVSGPTMTIVRPTSGAATSVGKSFTVEVRASDPNGVRIIGWRASGVLATQDSVIRPTVSGMLPDTATLISTVTVPAGTPAGTIAIVPFGADSLGDPSGTAPGVTVNVQSAASDATAPAVTSDVGLRVEVSDSITVTATDASGIKRIGWRAYHLPADTVVAGDSTVPDLDGSQSDVTRAFALNLPTTLRFPAQVRIEAYAVDASAGANRDTAVAETLTVVAGRTFRLPAGSQIADAIYNPNRRELYLSNTTYDRIEVFDLPTQLIVASIPVGSRPYGLAMWPKDTLGGVLDTLVVANSGGTNLSIVDVRVGQRREVSRHRIPNYEVEKVKTAKNATGADVLDITRYDFADRPQYVATVCRGVPASLTGCDSVIAVYSTTPTPSQSDPYGNRSYVAWENLTKAGSGHLFWEPAVGAAGTTTDTLQIVEVRDSISGVQARRVLLGAGLGVMVKFDNLLYHDTTFVRSAGNHTRALIGEGGVSEGYARVLMYDPNAGIVDSVLGVCPALVGTTLVCRGFVDFGVSDALYVQDFVGNRASTLRSIALNQTGRTALVRADSIYAFDYLLRQTGVIQAPSGADGMDFHPNNTFDAALRGSGGAGYQNSRLVFAARPDSSIDVFDTYFYGRVTDTTSTAHTIPVPIRNALIGPVRVATDLTETVLFGLTSRGLVTVRLPSVTNSLFPVAPGSLPMPIVTVPEQPSQSPRRPAGRGTSPPRE